MLRFIHPCIHLFNQGAFEISNSISSRSGYRIYHHPESKGSSAVAGNWWNSPWCLLKWYFQLNWESFLQTVKFLVYWPLCCKWWPQWRARERVVTFCEISFGFSGRYCVVNSVVLWTAWFLGTVLQMKASTVEGRTGRGLTREHFGGARGGRWQQSRWKQVSKSTVRRNWW